MNGLDKLAVVGLGELLWDVFPDGKILGGAPANFAFHVSRLGLDGWAVSAVGSDPDGDEILEYLSGKPLKTAVETVAYPTGRVDVTLDDKGVPQYIIAEDVAWDNIPFTDKISSLATRAGTVCFGSLAQRSPVSRETIRRFIAGMPEGSLKIFDINLRQHFYTPELLRESLQSAGILKINDEEVVKVASMFSIEGTETEICRRLMELYSLDMIVLTKGTDGSYVLAADGGESFMPTPRVKVADTVGAGDSFTAGFTAALLRGKSIGEAHAFAVEVSAYVCSQNGAMPELPVELVSRLGR